MLPEVYAQTLHALMQNKEFAEQYQKLTPDMQQQFLRTLNHEKVAEFLHQKNIMVNYNQSSSTSPSNSNSTNSNNNSNHPSMN